MELGLGCGDSYRCQVCPKSKVGSKFRSYVFFPKRYRDRHNQIFHYSLIKNRKRAKKTVVCTSRQDRIGSLSKFRCPEKTCLLPLSSGQALRRHLVSIHKLKPSKLPPTKRGKRQADDIAVDSSPAKSMVLKGNPVRLPTLGFANVPTVVPVPEHSTPVLHFPGVLCKPFSDNIPTQIVDICKTKWTEIFSSIEYDNPPALNWYEGARFSPSDFASLMREKGSSSWLTDNVLDFVGKMINNHPKSNSCFIFTSHLFDEYLADKNDAKRWVLSLLGNNFLLSIDKLGVNQLQIPVNLRQNHWVLIVVQIDSAQVFLLDPHTPKTNPGQKFGCTICLMNKISKQYYMDHVVSGPL